MLVGLLGRLMKYLMFCVDIYCSFPVHARHIATNPTKICNLEVCLLLLCS